MRTLLLIGLIFLGLTVYKADEQSTGVKTNQVANQEAQEGNQELVAGSIPATSSANPGSSSISPENLNVYVKSNSSKVEEADPRPEALDRFFARFNSPWEGQGNEFVDIAVKYKLDYRLLPIVGCVESSCGKNYRLNAFGWGSDIIAIDTEGVAEKIATLSYYKRYRETGSLADFAKSYNKPHWEEYLGKLTWFYQKLTRND